VIDSRIDINTDQEIEKAHLSRFELLLDSHEILILESRYRGNFMAGTRREFLKVTAAGLAATTNPALLAPRKGNTASPSGQITMWVTSGQKRFERVTSPEWQPVGDHPSTDTIELDLGQRHQEILGFGAAFTDASCYIFHHLTADLRAKILHDLFNPSEMALSVCRTCIGASDYSTELFSYDEGAPDPELKRFSIDHDKSYVLPMLREARETNPNLFLFSSPWSPPGWMKANNSMLGGCIRKTFFSSYAQHFVKFLQAYAAEGVPIQAITSQNEVDTDQDGRMPACVWGQEYEIEFIAKHLGPALEKAGLSTKIWLLDHNYNLWGRVICSLDEADVKKYCGAVAWHGYAGTANMISKVHAAHPEVAMHWTEGGPDYTSPTYSTDWASWAHAFTEAMQNWCSSIIGWNLALDERGRPNIGPFNCGGLITIHSQTKEVSKSGQYWALAHFSRLIRRGARRFATSGNLSDLDHIAFENPDGRRVLVITNPKSSRTVHVRSGAMVARVSLDSDSVNTLEWN
jgi:glucosylceramidase